MNPYKKTKLSQGFTLIELMLAIAFLSILMLIAMPSLSQFVQKQKLSTQAELISSTFGVARSEALSRLQDINVCWQPKSESGNNTSGTYPVGPGKMSVFFVNGSNTELIREIEYDVDNTLTVDDETDNCATYSPQGRLKSMTGTSLIFGVCRSASEEGDSRSIEISSTGRATVKKNQVNATTLKIACS